MDALESEGLSGPAFAARWLRRAGLAWAADLIETETGPKQPPLASSEAAR